MGANVLPFYEGWKFYRTELSATLAEAEAAGDCFRPVEIPHDWLIYDVKNLYRDGCGWYRKRFGLSGIKGPVILRFDGVYMDSTVYVNGRKVGDWKYGYSTFDMDITDAVKEGENEVMVQVRFQAPNSRWYSGAGIYRKVWIKRCGEAYLPLDGTYVAIRPCGRDNAAAEAPESPAVRTEMPGSSAAGTRTPGSPAVRTEAPGSPAVRTEMPGSSAAGTRTPGSPAVGTEAPGDFLLEAETETAGRTAGCFLRYSLWKDGAKVQELAETACGEPLCARVERPCLWDVDDPQCYELLVELCGRTEAGEERLWDWERITTGFRTIAFDPGKGCFLNGRHLKIHGVCEHHDLGCLGAAFHAGAMERKLKLLKAMGVNAIRTSHNMQAPEFMELADRMGFLVDNEAFDMWERPKTAYDYSRFFKEWAERDVRSWVRRDRNHPCMLLWSIGNEIYDTHADERGQEITRRLTAYVREHDPRGNAPVTIGSNYMAWENAQKCADIVRFAGYNYGEKYYAEQHREHPHWILYGSETASLVQSRGIYHFPLRQPVLAEEDEQCSALGNSTTSWGARSLERCIMGDRDAAYIFGQFLWSGFDYIGEPTPYHTKNSYFGQIDTAGFPKDAYYVFQAEWTDYRRAPMVHLFPFWDFNPGQLIDVRACTNAPAVELFVNGVSQGRQEIDHGRGERLLGDWQVPYEPGVITAVACDETGREIARDSRSSFGDSRAIRLAADRETLRADGEELCFLTIETVDARGNQVENAADYVRVDIGGPGRLLGMDNGDSTDYDQYKTNVRKLFSGKLLAVIGGAGEAGEIRVTVTGEGLKSAEIRLRAQAALRPAERCEDCPAERCEDCPEKRYEDCPEKRYENCPAERYEDCPAERCEDCPEERYEDCPAERYEDCPAERYEDCPVERCEDCPAERHEDCPQERYTGCREECGGRSGARAAAGKDDKRFQNDSVQREEDIWAGAVSDNMCFSTLPRRHPVRKVELHALEGQCITEEKRQLAIEAVVYPPEAEPELVWRAVNEGGIEVGFAEIRETPADSLKESSAEGHSVGESMAGEGSPRESPGKAPSTGKCPEGTRCRRAVVTACGDGEFYVRCMAREEGRITVISQLEFKAEGLGKAFLNPYELVSAGLYTDTLGEIGNGNEKGIATARDGVSGVVYSGLDFGEFGSDEITLPVFALSDEEYPIELWLGKPCAPGSRLLDTLIYRKPSRWNTYQEETWRLPERIRGVATLGFVMRAKVHLKGFRFTRQEKAFQRLRAAEADSVYGDSFERDGGAVRNIGNNVTLVYENMDFGEGGADSVVICGRTPLERNSIHIHFTDPSGETANRILEFAGGGGREREQTFSIDRLAGSGRVELIFLPGSRFDLVSVQFCRKPLH